MYGSLLPLDYLLWSSPICTGRVASVCQAGSPPRTRSANCLSSTAMGWRKPVHQTHTSCCLPDRLSGRSVSGAHSCCLLDSSHFGHLVFAPYLNSAIFHQLGCLSLIFGYQPHFWQLVASHRQSLLQGRVTVLLGLSTWLFQTLFQVLFRG